MILKKGVLILLVILPLASILRAQDSGIYRWNDARGDWDESPGQHVASRVSVGPDGSPWVVDSKGSISHLVGDAWQAIPGRAKDIAVSGDGSVWVIGGDPNVLGNDDVYKREGSSWRRFDGAALNISVGESGMPWVVTSEGATYRLVRGVFVDVKRQASDVAIGGRVDTAWVTAPSGEIFYMSRRGTWVQVPGRALRISVGPDGMPWVVTEQRTIYRWASDHFELMPGLANDIGIGADGSVWVIGYSPAAVGYSLPAGSMSFHAPEKQKQDPAPAPNVPLPGGKHETLVCRGSRDPNDFPTSHRIDDDRPGLTVLRMCFGLMNGGAANKISPGYCIVDGRDYREDDPQCLVEEVADDTIPTAAETLRKPGRYWLFHVFPYVTRSGERYFKVLESRETGAPIRFDDH